MVLYLKLSLYKAIGYFLACVWLCIEDSYLGFSPNPMSIDPRCWQLFKQCAECLHPHVRIKHPTVLANSSACHCLCLSVPLSSPAPCHRHRHRHQRWWLCCKVKSCIFVTATCSSFTVTCLWIWFSLTCFPLFSLASEFATYSGVVAGCGKALNRRCGNAQLWV